MKKIKFNRPILIEKDYKYLEGNEERVCKIIKPIFNEIGLIKSYVVMGLKSKEEKEVLKENIINY